MQDHIAAGGQYRRKLAVRVHAQSAKDAGDLVHVYIMYIAVTYPSTPTHPQTHRYVHTYTHIHTPTPTPTHPHTHTHTHTPPPPHTHAADV